MEADQAVKFIERMFSHAAHDRMAILAVPRCEGKAEQRVFTLGQATSRKVQGWLRHLNARDYDIYLLCKPGAGWIWWPGEGGYRRDPPAAAGPGRGGSRGPGPCLRGRGQGRAAAAGPCAEEFEGALSDPVGYGSGEWEIEVAEAVMRALAVRYGGDRAATDVSRVMRMPGVQEQEAGQDRGLGHLGLAWGAVGEAGGFPRTGCARAGPAKWGPAQDAARALLPERAGLGRGGRRAQERRGTRDGDLTA